MGCYLAKSGVALKMPRSMLWVAFFAGWAFTLGSPSNAQASTEAPEFLKDLLDDSAKKAEPLKLERQKRAQSVNDLVNPLVQSVSRVSEPASEAPAWVLVITGKELFERGYFRLSLIHI